MKNFSIIIIFIFLFEACDTGTPKYKALEYKPTIHLKGKLLNNNFMFSNPAEMFVIDSLLIIHDSQKQDYCFHIFSVNTGRYIKSFGAKGRGPGEVLFPESMNYSENRKVVTTYDSNLRKIVLYNISSILNNRKYSFTEIQITNSPNFVYQALPYKNNFILRGSDSKMRFGIMDTLQNVKFCYTEMPFIVSDNEENMAILNYVPQCAISPNGEKMILSTYIGSIFEILNVSENKICTDTVQYYYPPIYNVLKGYEPKWIGTTPKTIIGCHSLFVTNDTIYTIYEGESAKENLIHKKLMLFNWNGEFCKQYSFEEGDPISLCIDDKNKQLYCIILNDKYEYQIYNYSYNFFDNNSDAK